MLDHRVKRFLVLLLVVLGLATMATRNFVVFAETDDEQLRQIEEDMAKLAELKKLSENATAPLEKELVGLEARINRARAGIATAKKKIVELSQKIDEREEDLAVQYVILSKRIAANYKRARLNTPLLMFFSNQSASNITKDLMYRSSVEAQDNRLISKMGEEISALETDTKKLEQDQVHLAALEKQLDEQAAFFKGEIDKAKEYQKDLSGKIAALSAQQQSILSAKSGSSITSVGSVPVSGDVYATYAGFKSNAPSGSFAVFAFGSFTHRNGMSQYGAKARAGEGQDYKQILNAYYGKEPVSKDTGGNIKVASYGEMDFETKYLYGIAEMPDSWAKEALKAQAVAARTFAYRNYKTKGTEICTNEACQAFSKSKSDNPPQAWREAVDETKGMILEDISTQYSAIAGGYLNTSGWDTTDKSNSGAWTSRAWEVKVEAPWFYKSWYREVKRSGAGRYSDSNSDCGRKPWMNQEEMSDILNSYIIMYKDNSKGAETSRILPVTLNSCYLYDKSGNRITGNPYPMDELRSKTNDPVTSISGVSVSNNNNGQTTQVKFSTNRGDVIMSGTEFKEVFNTRAPGYLAIHQSGFSFFNIEKN